MTDETSHDATPYLPKDPGSQRDLNALRQASAGCRGCPLYENATQTVFGAGPQGARVVFVGEVPGDQEDRKGAPFVGPAGHLFDRALVEAGIERDEVYLTNAVKHFKFKHPEGGGKRRIHETPSAREVRACRPWLLAELRAVEPELVVALGAVAGKALMGTSFRVTKQRGELLALPETTGMEQAAGAETWLVATIHPSAILRADDREAVYAGFVNDLKVAAEALA
jgi:uracil-DNA glycosylase family protein